MQVYWELLAVTACNIFLLFHFSLSSDCICLLSSVCLYVSALLERNHYFFLSFCLQSVLQL